MLKYRLTIEDVTTPILKNISVTWHQGEIVALMGPNGSGKSSLARVAAGLRAGLEKEVCLWKGDQSISWNEVPRWKAVGLIGQHPRRQCIGATIGEEISFGLLNLGYNGAAIKSEIKAVLKELGLEGRENHSPATLSGGERQRLAAAAVLTMKPHFLILDEAFSMLDQRAEENLLAMLKSRRDMGQLWVTHDKELALRADRVLLMKDGRLYDGGKPEDVFGDKELCARYDLDFYTEPPCPEHLSDRPAKSFLKESSVLKWEKAYYGNDKNIRLVVDKTVYQKEFIGILGPSGSGKSTLLESSVGLHLPWSGKAETLGTELTASNKKAFNALRKKARLILQEGGEFLYGQSVYNIVFSQQSRAERKEKQADNMDYLQQWGLDEKKASMPPEQLSGGERQIAALAQMFYGSRQVLLLDEPLLGLDTNRKRMVLSFLRQIKEKTILYVTHDLREVLPLADRLWLVENGEIGMECAPADWEIYADRLKKAGVKIG